MGQQFVLRLSQLFTIALSHSFRFGQHYFEAWYLTVTPLGGCWNFGSERFSLRSWQGDFIVNWSEVVNDGPLFCHMADNHGRCLACAEQVGMANPNLTRLRPRPTSHAKLSADNHQLRLLGCSRTPRYQRQHEPACCGSSDSHSGTGQLRQPAAWGRPASPPPTADRDPVLAIPQVGGLHHRYQRCAA